MNTIVTKRGFKHVILFIIHFTLFFAIYTSFQKEANNTRIQTTKLFSENDNVTEEQYMPYYSKSDSINSQFGVLYAFSALVVIFMLYKDLQKSRDIMVVMLLVITIIYVLYPYRGDFSVPIETKGFENLTYYSYYYSFFSYGYLIFKYSIIGIKEDITKQVRQEVEVVHNNMTDDLDRLFKLNLLSKDEYLSKKEIHIKEKIKVDLKETEEYNLLVKSKSIGLINEVEFNTKLNGLIENAYKDRVFI